MMRAGEAWAEAWRGGPAHQMGPPLVKRQTEMTEDITFLQIAYAGGN